MLQLGKRRKVTHQWSGAKRRIQEGWIRRVRNKGLTLPGYNYLGPFNSLDNGEPTNASDQAAKEHDEEYGRMGARAYFLFNDADEKFIRNTGNDVGGRLGRFAFQIKKKLAPKITAKPRPSIEVLRKPFVRPSLLKKQAEAQVSTNTATMSKQDGKGSGMGAHNNETGRDPIPYDVCRGIPSYMYASLPWYSHKYMRFSGKTVDFDYRMTSVYDPFRAPSLTAIDINKGSGTSQVTNVYAPGAQVNNKDGVNQQVMWYQFYSNLYKYYSVVGCRYKITIRNMTSNDLWVGWGFRGQARTWPKAVSHVDMLHWPDVHMRRLHPKIAYYNTTNGNEVREFYDGTTGVVDIGEQQNLTTNSRASMSYVANNETDTVTISGEYRPGDYDREIQTDELVETWTAIHQNPKLLEALGIRIMNTQGISGNSGASAEQNEIVVEMVANLDYLVEFKELHDGLHWPSSNQPIPRFTAQLTDPTGGKSSDETPAPVQDVDM